MFPISKLVNLHGMKVEQAFDLMRLHYAHLITSKYEELLNKNLQLAQRAENELSNTDCYLNSINKTKYGAFKIGATLKFFFFILLFIFLLFIYKI